YVDIPLGQRMPAGIGSAGKPGDGADTDFDTGMSDFQVTKSGSLKPVLRNGGLQATFMVSGDRELWLLKGENFCLPLYLRQCVNQETKSSHYLIVPAIRVTAAQYETLESALRRHSVGALKE